MPVSNHRARRGSTSRTVQIHNGNIGARSHDRLRHDQTQTTCSTSDYRDLVFQREFGECPLVVDAASSAHNLGRGDAAFVGVLDPDVFIGAGMLALARVDLVFVLGGPSNGGGRKRTARDGGVEFRDPGSQRPASRHGAGGDTEAIASDREAEHDGMMKLSLLLGPSGNGIMGKAQNETKKRTAKEKEVDRGGGEVKENNNDEESKKLPTTCRALIHCYLTQTYRLID